MIKICSNSESYDEVCEYLAMKGIGFDAEGCLGRCDLCHSGAFVQYGDDFISADNVELLVIKLEALKII